jgi:hypothetical protein
MDPDPRGPKACGFGSPILESALLLASCESAFVSVRKVNVLFVLLKFMIIHNCLLFCAVDILRLLFLHVYCFYAYARRLTLSQLTGCLALSRLFRGKKYNPLRDRYKGRTQCGRHY